MICDVTMCDWRDCVTRAIMLCCDIAQHLDLLCGSSLSSSFYFLDFTIQLATMESRTMEHRRASTLPSFFFLYINH